ncbi:hypothetical protein AVEN_149779-1 [Araneus ventricosus]|uniref:Reverse transcriptase domain-containing protein n=1 Tax=Araneus ventricosus TaxID=182803 RepID=A0A4Y2K9J1_ARAVE|nr:hypothetical protein AVEN_149779-1 [Araneus ventricosus]
MPFGLDDAPYFFSKLMAQVLQHCDNYAVPYLDDIAIHSDNGNDHLQHIGKVLENVKPCECRCAKNRTKYLGHIVGNGVWSPIEAKIMAVVNFPTPTTKTQIRAFLRSAGYYAHYVKNSPLLQPH